MLLVLFDNFVGTIEQCRQNRQAERLGGFPIELLETRNNGRGIIYNVGFVLVILRTQRDTVVFD